MLNFPPVESAPNTKVSWANVTLSELKLTEQKPSSVFGATLRQMQVFHSTACASVPWCIGHVGRTAGWWAPWWERWQTAPPGCRAHTPRGPNLIGRGSMTWQDALICFRETAGEFRWTEIYLRCPSSSGLHLCGDTVHTSETELVVSVTSLRQVNRNGWMCSGWWHTYHACSPLLRLTLPAEPRAGGDLNDAVARWVTKQGIFHFSHIPC